MLRNNYQKRNRFQSARPYFYKNKPQNRKELDIHHYIKKLSVEAGYLNKPVDEQVSLKRFFDFGLDQRLLRNVGLKGYVTATPIQTQVIPLALKGNDVIGLANTGTGKTAAFLLPLINKILGNRSQKALIVAPTRELAAQINEDFKGFSKDLNIFSVLCIGGSNMRNQEQNLKRPFNFLIGTPGRIIDLTKRRLINLDGFQNAVIDEADRMVDMGFIRDMQLIFSKLPKLRQTMLFTATMGKDEEAISKQFLTNPLTVSVKRSESPPNVEQQVLEVSHQSEKIAVLMNLLRKPDFIKVLVFGRTKFGVEKISKKLQDYGFRVDSIHGNKTQNYRIRALNNFKIGAVKVLVATDVAARGLHIEKISHVVNYDLPANYDDYIHRIGRTGRADAKGKAISLVVR